jgi:hypothetical protein
MIARAAPSHIHVNCPRVVDAFPQKKYGKIPAVRVADLEPEPGWKPAWQAADERFPGLDQVIGIHRFTRISSGVRSAQVLR